MIRPRNPLADTLDTQTNPQRRPLAPGGERDPADGLLEEDCEMDVLDRAGRAVLALSPRLQAAVLRARELSSLGMRAAHATIDRMENARPTFSRDYLALFRSNRRPSQTPSTGDITDNTPRPAGKSRFLEHLPESDPNYRQSFDDMPPVVEGAVLLAGPLRDLEACRCQLGCVSRAWCREYLPVTLSAIALSVMILVTLMVYFVVVPRDLG